jgi:DNA-binding transcriptional LysR family regulator
LIEPARQLLLQASTLPALAQQAHQGALGRLRLGFVSTVGFGPLPAWLRGFREAQPGVVVSLQEATGDVQLRALAQGEADAGFLLHAPGMVPVSVGDDARELHHRPVGNEPLVLALPESSPLATARRLDLAQVLAQPIIIFPRDIAPSVFDALLAFYHQHSVSPQIVQQAIQMQTIVNLVSAGLGLAWVPQAMTQLRRPGVVYRSLPVALARVAPRCETSLVWLDDASPTVARFVAHVAANPG